MVKNIAAILLSTKPVRKSVFKEDLTDHEAKMEDLRRGSAGHYERRLRRKDGQTVWTLISASPLLDGEQHFQGFFAMITDISERKAVEEERVRLATVIKQTSEGVVITDRNWIVQYINPAFERMSGNVRSEVIGRHSRFLRSDTHDEAFYREIRETVSRGEVWSGHIVNKKMDGSSYDSEATVSAVRDKSGAVINYVGIHKDITNEIGFERQLRQAQKMEAIGTLAGGIAHDFNNILTSIIGYTEMTLFRLPEGSPLRHGLEQVRKAGHRATNLVSQILSFSRQVEQEKKPVSLAPIVKEALKLLRSTIPSTIEIRQDIETSPEGDVVLADPTQVHQVLMNVCTNAAHAMRATGGVLSVGLSEVEADSCLVTQYADLNPGRYLGLSVSDTGHGMTPEVMERTFDPYFTTKEPGEGTGIGLSVVMGIVKGHGGAIRVFSRPGRGATFHVLLPVNDQKNAPKTEASPVLPTGSERVLFIDDEQAIAGLGQEMLSSLGYQVTMKTSSLEALEVFRTQPDAFDLVITDMTMPGLTGMDLTKELRVVRPNTPFILCSGFSEMVDEKKAKDAGIREFVMKPYAITDLAVTVRKVLGEKPGCT